MADPIKPPPLPRHPEKYYMWTDMEIAALRARDLEVARVVLEAAAQSAEIWHANGIEIEIAREIRALEVKHG